MLKGKAAHFKPHTVIQQRFPGLFNAVLFLIVCICWGTTWLGIKISVESIPPLTSAGLRFLVAFPLFLMFAFLRRETIFFPRDKIGFFIFVTACYFCLPYYFLNYGEQYVSSGLTSLLFSTMPVFIIIFSTIFQQDRIYYSQLAGIIIGFASLLMIIRSQHMQLDFSELSGVAAILAAAIMHALCYVITKQKGKDIGVVTYNTLPIGIAGLGLFLIGLASEQPDFAGITARSWGAMIYLGIVASVGGFIVYFFLLKRLSAVILSFVFIIFPVFAILLGAWYENLPVSNDLIFYSILLLIGFAITKLPIEKFLEARGKQP